MRSFRKVAARYERYVITEELRALEAERIRALMILFGIYAGLFALLYGYNQRFDPAWFEPSLQTLGVVVKWAPAVLVMIFARLLFIIFTEKFRTRFQELVIAPLIETIDPEFYYAPHGAVPLALFNLAHFSPEHSNHYSGHDKVRGHVEDLPVIFSSVHAERRYSLLEVLREHHETLFKGLFIVVDFNKYFRGRTIVLPDDFERFVGTYISDFFQSRNPSRHEAFVKMDDPEFERYFLVYGSDQVEARYVLTHTMMEQLVTLRKRSGKRIYVTFNASRIFIGVSSRRDLLDPCIFHTLLSVEQVRNYVESLQLATDLVRGLKLNEKLWSKQ